MVLKSQLLTCYHLIIGTLGGAQCASKSRSSTRCRGRPGRGQKKRKGVDVSADPEDTDPSLTKLARVWVGTQRRFGCLDEVIASRQKELDLLQEGCGSED